ncbi:serine hydrolase domain-containing protein [Nocardia goodfellowii]|uniref:D-alanyl-D-alanine carboxypeptidase n=1 Tax=Nocardia goodfellowii TaxID=882446 RepID=A0ABS4QNC4_9NOCA|nr:serine hydrolase domain-containing protein [Nocardia goodfellowii]MBP2192534.1 D-alanyl-D-alanine carboxypeptidase [Nocardia goodfellowii]
MRLRVFTVPLCTAAVLLSACTTSTAEPASASIAARMDTVRGDLDAAVRSGAVGAVATLTDNGATAVSTSGLADIATGTAISADVPQHVRIGSVTKTFTAAIALQLVAENRIDLDRPIGTYLPGLLAGDGVDGNAITVRQILGHRSGLPEPTAYPHLNEYTAARDGHTYTPAQEIALALRSPAQFAPGTRFAYTNTNYIVAGMLIEAVTGHRFTDELRDRILTPLRLADTYLPATGETGLRAPHPTGYATLEGTVTDVTRMEPSVPWTSGSLVSTGADLNRFYLALLAGKVVPQTQLRQMLDGVDMGNGDGMSYGLGVGYAQLPCGAQYVGHVGGVVGFTAISGATAAGRAVTFSFTGSPAAVDIGTLLTHALCG